METTSDNQDNVTEKENFLDSQEKDGFGRTASSASRKFNQNLEYGGEDITTTNNANTSNFSILIHNRSSFFNRIILI